jgi:hypothetical protein
MSNQIDVTKEVESLVKKAEKAEKSDDALKFSQAACNSANAMACLQTIQNVREKIERKVV